MLNLMQNSIFVIGKVVHGHHVLVTKGMIAREVLDGMNEKGWILSRVEQQEANFHYDFIRERGQKHIS